MRQIDLGVLVSDRFFRFTSENFGTFQIFSVTKPSVPVGVEKANFSQPLSIPAPHAGQAFWKKQGHRPAPRANLR
jgi:hypothetical protein